MVAGGVGIDGNLYVGGTSNFNDVNITGTLTVNNLNNLYTSITVTGTSTLNTVVASGLVNITDTT